MSGRTAGSTWSSSPAAMPRGVTGSWSPPAGARAWAASVGAMTGDFTATVRLSDVARTATYTRAYEARPGFVTLVSDGERLIGAYAVGPEAGEWLQQVTLAIRARIPLVVLLDVVQPFPTFSEALFHALRDLSTQLSGSR